MFERLARKEELEAAPGQGQDVFKEATEEEKRQQSEPSEANTLPMTSSTEVNGQGNADVEMQEDEKGGVKC